MSPQHQRDPKSRPERPMDLKRIEKISKKKGVFYSHVSSFFTWLGALIGDEVQSEAKEAVPHPSLKKSQVIPLTEHRPEEVRKRAQSICENLEELKKQLATKFDGSAGGFIGKSLDTMIFQAKNIIDRLHGPDPESHEFQDFLQQAVVDVDLYSQLNTESKIKKKIIQEAYEFIRLSIDKDIGVLTNYKLHAVTDLSVSSDQKTDQSTKLDQFLNPVINELKNICETQVASSDLETFFNWKSTVDERRGALVELGLLTIDALTSPFRMQEAFISDQEHELELLESESATMKGQLEEYSLSLSFLSSLEDRFNKCVELLEQIPAEDVESLKLVHQLFSDLKIESARLIDFETESPSIQRGFQSLKESILKADTLLQSKFLV